MKAEYFGFFLGLFVSYFASLYFLASSDKRTGEVLAESVVFEEKREIFFGPEKVVTPSPSPSPSPKPTKKPTPTPSPTASPSPTPTGTPGPTPDVWSPPDMTPIFQNYANVYGIDVNILERLANCESHFNPNAVSGDYVGMFQFSSSSWVTFRGEMGFDASVALRSNIEESIRTAAYVLQTRGTAPWPACIEH